jgi:hypothetical protein
MTYFECFMVAAWMFAIGWFLGAIYVQDLDETTDRQAVIEVPEPSPDSEAWQFPAVASASAAD